MAGRIESTPAAQCATMAGIDHRLACMGVVLYATKSYVVPTRTIVQL